MVGLKIGEQVTMILVRANLTRLTSPLNSTQKRFMSHLLLTLLLYFLLIFYLPQCTLPDFPSVSALAFMPFLSCCHVTTKTTKTRAACAMRVCNNKKKSFIIQRQIMIFFFLCVINFIFLNIVKTCFSNKRKTREKKSTEI